MTIYFDLDGPLLDIAARHHAVYRSIIAGLGARPLTRSDYWRLKRGGWKEADVCREHHPGIDPALYGRLFIDRIESPGFLARDTLVDNALATLAVLRGRHRLALATMRRRGESMRREIKALGLTSSLDTILQRENNDGAWRNKAEMILGDLGPDHEAVLVGDSEGDILAARVARISAVAVCNGMRSREVLASHAPDLLIDSIARLASCVSQGEWTAGRFVRDGARTAE